MNTKQYTELVQLNADKLYRYIVKQGVHTEEAKDIVQNCFEALWNSNVQDMLHGAKYLFATAHHQCVDHWRKAGRVTYKAELPETIPSGTNANANLQPWLHNALQQLSTQERSLILLKDYEGYSYEEIADIHKLSGTQVKVYLHRARTKLKNYIGSLKQVI
jgi:RNA polymerase sigma factor (sigma-70 family)